MSDKYSRREVLGHAARGAVLLGLGGTAAVLDELRRLAGSPEVVLVVGHEPTWSDLIEVLTGSDVRFPTAARARLDFDTEWAGLGPDGAVLTWLVLPRDLEAARRG